MAESWIKMRGNLLTNPKVIRMARMLLQDPEFLEWFGVTERHVSVTPRHDSVTASVTESVTKTDARRHAQNVTVVTRVTVGTLLPTWSTVRECAGTDGLLLGASLFEVDAIAGVPGFGKALLAVDWIELLPNEEGVRFINFGEHNSAGKERSTSAQTPAERAAAYRERKKAKEGETERHGVTDRHVTERDEKRDASRDVVTTEKSREEKKKRDTSAAKLPTCPTQLIVDLYHEVLPELPGVRVMDKTRGKAIDEFWRWVLTTNRPDGTPRAKTTDEALAWTRDYLTRARQNDFIMGRGTRSAEHANWRCSIEYLLSTRGMKKVIEETPEHS
jgi:hypothetical protein